MCYSKQRREGRPATRREGARVYGWMALVVSVGVAVGGRLAQAGVSFLELQKIRPVNLTTGKAAGVSLAFDGERALLGAEDTEMAWAFREGNGGLESAGVLEPGEDAGGKYAWAVAMDGDWAAVGAFSALDSEGFDTGAVDVFRRTGEAWTFETRLWADDGQAGDQFGIDLAIEGGTLVIGASGVDAVSVNAGAAYIFEFDGEDWSQTQKVWASDGNRDATLGRSVAISGTTFVAGAARDDYGGLNAGAAYVFDKVDGQWQSTMKLKASNVGAQDRMGASVDIDGDRVIAGAFREDTKGVDAGSAYIFERDEAEGQWSQVKQLTASDGKTLEFFGSGVAIEGDLAAVGSLRQSATGRVYLFEAGDDGDWEEVDRVDASDGEPGDHFGATIEINGSRLLVAATGDDDLGQDAGAAYLFTRGVLGDMDGNGVFDAFDVDDFELALADRQAYLAARPGLDPDFLGDFDGNGGLDAFDVDDFERVLSGGAVPEPGISGLMMVIAAMGMTRRGHSRG